MTLPTSTLNESDVFGADSLFDDAAYDGRLAEEGTVQGVDETIICSSGDNGMTTSGAAAGSKATGKSTIVQHDRVESFVGGPEPVLLQSRLEGINLMRNRLLRELSVLNEEEKRILGVQSAIQSGNVHSIQLGLDSGVEMSQEPVKRVKRQFSEESRRKIREAQLRRWSNLRKAGAAKAKSK